MLGITHNLITSLNDDYFRLRPVEEKDLIFLMNLRNHAETIKFLGNNTKIDLESQNDWFSNLKYKIDKAYYIFERSISKPIANEWFSIGMIRTHDIDLNNNHMGVGGDIDYTYRGKGYAKAMYELIFKLGFDKLNLHRLWLSVLEYNVVARNLYKKLGFKETGVQREAVFKDGKYFDYIYMDILESEYKMMKEFYE